MLSFGAKLLLNGMILVPFLVVFGDVPIVHAILAALVLCIIAYVAGDQLLLRKTNTGIATLADVIMVYVFLWAGASFLGWTLNQTELILIALALGVIEFFLHLTFQADEARAR